MNITEGPKQGRLKIQKKNREMNSIPNGSIQRFLESPKYSVISSLIHFNAVIFFSFILAHLKISGVEI